MDTQTELVPVLPVLGQWLSGLALSAVPRSVIEHLKVCVLDSLGCGLFGSRQEWGKIASNVAVSFSDGGPSSLFARREKVSPGDAALANGTAIHGFEIDDAHVSSSLHPAAVTLPAGLALAEARGASGTEMLVALAGGYEVGLRVGICAGLAHSTSGFHVTGTVGSIAAAAAAARVLHLSPIQTAHALGIGATQAAGLYSARTGAMTKRFHAGRAAQSGVIAACFAEQGFTGSLDAIDAPFGGFMSTMRGQFDRSAIMTKLGDNWEIVRVGLKPYAACASAHTTIDGIRELRSRGLAAENLKRLTIRMSKKGHINIGWPYQPREVITAQMNGYYAAAVTLLDGDAFIEQYSVQRLADPAILALIPLIDIVHDPEIDKAGAGKRHTVKIDAALKDGRVLSTMIEQRRGSAERPLSRCEVDEKFQRLTEGIVPKSSSDELIGIVGELELERNLTRLIAAITACVDSR